jgi:lipopolysaccharide/colanic/teichoic acid biosynthesis glycosyltransferase
VRASDFTSYLRIPHTVAPGERNNKKGMPGRKRNSNLWLLLSALERLAALCLLAALAPLMLIVAVATAALSRTSPLIAHRRLGLGGRPLWVLKFRTMWRRGAQPAGRFALVEYIVDESGPLEKGVRDHRICSPFARFCRRHSIDELPQLLHVVRGEMSLVGPRPVTDSEWKLYYCLHAAEVLDVKPGLSGLWQTTGRGRLTYEQRRDLDLALARNRSLKLYFQILLWTLPEIWSGRNAW